MSVNKLEIGKVYRVDKSFSGIYEYFEPNDLFILLNFHQHSFLEMKILKNNNEIINDFFSLRINECITKLSP